MRFKCIYQANMISIDFRKSCLTDKVRAKDFFTLCLLVKFLGDYFQLMSLKNGCDELVC
jgi:hypothetical protein